MRETGTDVRVLYGELGARVNVGGRGTDSNSRATRDVDISEENCTLFIMNILA